MQQWLDRKTIQMFLLSFLIMFFELLCIRWFPSKIRHLGYFTNYVLMAAFLGIGTGVLWGKRGKNLLLYFIPLLALIQTVLYILNVEVRIPTDEVLFFQGFRHDYTPVEPLYLIPLIFLLIAGLFTFLSSPLGSLFQEMQNLTAYSANIGGSLAGIACFTLFSALRIPPFLSMIFFFIILMAILKSSDKVKIVMAVIALLSVWGFWTSSRGSIWSMYYNITPRPFQLKEDLRVSFDIWVNGTEHQMLIPSKFVDREEMYGEVFKHFPREKFKDVLIVGAGGGRDTAYCLSRGVEHIDAVEIDPVLRDFGATLHPERPYLDRRVNTHVQDARNYMLTCSRKYDCIIYALPDSLVLSSQYSSLRLESYLFTLESFKEAENLLKPDGVLVMYNYFRKKWLVEKLASMLDDAFGYYPAIFPYADNATCLITGPGSRNLKGEDLSLREFYPATDDWPFLYLKKPSFPTIYLWMIGTILLITLLLYFVSTKKSERGLDWAFFFLGAAFMLLETKSVVNFSLLFGSTWVVNSIVFFTILVLVLGAIIITNRIEIKNRFYLYLALVITVLLNYLVPTRFFLAGPVLLKNVAAPVFYLLPVFFANMIFTYSFKDSRDAAVAYTSNMLGAIVGGLCEYLSMVTGYNSMLMGVVLFYLLAFYFFRKKMGTDSNINI
ncbi:MAG: spermidine synthase [Candidatus Xenobiia bacterium LiM19]